MAHLKHGIALIVFLFIIGCTKTEDWIIPKTDEDNGGLFLPDGFGALVVVDSIGASRHLAVNDNGDIYVKLRIPTRDKGNIALRDTDGDGKADIIQRFGKYPNDGAFATEMRIHNGYLYFSSELVIYRQKLTPFKLIPEGKPEVLLRDQYPIRWHNAKSLAFDNQGNMYVTFSGMSNVCENWKTVPEQVTQGVKGYFPCPELEGLGGIWRFDENKLNQIQSDGELYATGIRSMVAMSWNYQTNSLFGLNHGRDYLHGHDSANYSPWENAILPAEEFMEIDLNDNFGWPYSYYNQFKHMRIQAPEYGGDGVKEAEGYKDPILGLPAHWAPNDLLFYIGDQFPKRYKNGAFVALHGSTNRAPYPQAGYFVAFIPFEKGVPKGKWEVFADGFAGVDVIHQMADAKYRPMGLSEGPDGSLYISESKKGKIWRIIYTDDKTKFKESHLDKMEQRKLKAHLRTPNEDKDLLSILE
jgi:glucose/arabinose dehydrogenase